MQLSHKSLIRAYRSMATIRQFEERVQEEFSKGNIPGFVHLYAGQEASAVGVCSHLGPGQDDWKYESNGEETDFPHIVKTSLSHNREYLLIS